MEYDVIKELKKSDKNTVQLVRETNGEQFFIRKILKGRHPIYETLQDCPHPCLPKLYEVILSDDATTIIEEYIEGQSPTSTELSEKQFLSIVRELCSVLEFLHGKGIIHRDIKPSNIILTKDGHIRLIDFDAARIYKDGLDQDTRQLGTRGYAPPEQYGFSQTDERSDIYSLGVTLRQIGGTNAAKPHYKQILSKCTDPDPYRRYQSVWEVKQAFLSGKKFFHKKLSEPKRALLYSSTALVLAALFGSLWKFLPPQTMPNEGMSSENTELTILPAPDNPHWDGETGGVAWGNVPESGVGNEVKYYIRLYRMDTPTPPSPDSTWLLQHFIRGNVVSEPSLFQYSVSDLLQENGFYYFAVSAAGDGINYTDSPYVMSDVFEFTGESAPLLPAPTGLAWRMVETEEDRMYYATWDNLDDYEDQDHFNVVVYDKDGNYVMNNVWTKAYIEAIGYNGIKIRPEFLTESGNAYRFTVAVWSSRPNEYRSNLVPDPIPEERFSPWYHYY